MAITLDALKQVKADSGYDCFIETGTALGQGVNRAFEAGFNIIMSCERYGEAYRNIDRGMWTITQPPPGCFIGLFFGDSADMLGNMLAACPRPAIVYLDAHTMNSTPQWKDHPAPVVQEIRQIGRPRMYGGYDIILIDDMRMFAGRGHNRWGNIRKAELLAALAAVGYTQISYVDGETPNDVMVARKG